MKNYCHIEYSCNSQWWQANFHLMSSCQEGVKLPDKSNIGDNLIISWWRQFEINSYILVLND